MKIKSTSKTNNSYNNDSPIFLRNSIAEFHFHAVDLNSRDFAGPSGISFKESWSFLSSHEKNVLPAEFSSSDLSVAHSNGTVGVVITSTAEDYKTTPEGPTLLVNVDLYAWPSHNKPPFIVDMGEFDVPIP